MKDQGNIVLRSGSCPSCDLIRRLAPSIEAVPALSSEQALKFEVNDREQLFERLKRADLSSGATLIGELIATPLGDIFWMSDPSGNLVQFISASEV